MGAGLAGLAAARDLEAGGAQVTVLEARSRVGGRVEQVELADGRLVQLGGEVVGNAHTSYLGLVEELGLTLVPSYVAEPGELTRQIPEDAVDRRLAVLVLRRRPRLARGGRGPPGEAGLLDRPGRPVRPPRAAPARPAQRRRLPARGRCHRRRPAGHGPGAPEPVRRLDRAAEHVRLRPQAGGRRRDGGLRRHGVGEPAGRRGLGHGRAGHGRAAHATSGSRPRSRGSRSAPPAAP